MAARLPDIDPDAGPRVVPLPGALLWDVGVIPDAQIGATMRSDKGALLAANWAAPNSAIAPSLGRNLSNNAPTATVNLITPGTLYGDRVNELDVRIGKIVKIGRLRTSVGIDVFNVLNADAVLTYNQAFVPNGTWLQPLSNLTPRFVKFGMQIDF